MSTRISTSALHNSAVTQIMKQQAQLSRTQNQVASGKRVEKPSDDPIAAARILDLERSQKELDQYATNSNLLQSRLSLGEQSLANIDTVLTRVRELVLQANNASVDESARSSILTEIRSRTQELMDVANTRDASGEFLFSGYSTGIAPVTRTAAGVIYNGDQGTRSLQIGPNQKIADGFPGTQVFMLIPEGNGTFTTSQGVHNGTGSIDTGQVTNAAAWVRGTYTISFTAPGTYEVRDATNTLVTSGAYTSGNSVTFNGVSMKISGEPATGDTFVVAPAGTESIFKTLDDIVAALAVGDSPSGRSTLSTDMAAALTQLDQASNRVVNLRGEVGARLSSIENTGKARDLLEDELSVSVSQLRDIDYAEAISRMSQQLTSLQAAQAAYAKISQLSLFDYL
jgi:flagellar hook-associated protein 3 FlgL